MAFAGQIIFEAQGPGLWAGGELSDSKFMLTSMHRVNITRRLLLLTRLFLLFSRTI